MHNILEILRIFTFFRLFLHNHSAFLYINFKKFEYQSIWCRRRRGLQLFTKAIDIQINHYIHFIKIKKMGIPFYKKQLLI